MMVSSVRYSYLLELLRIIVSQSFLIFDHLDIFAEHSPIKHFIECASLYMLLCYLYYQKGMMDLGDERTEVNVFLSHSIKGVHLM